MNTGAMTARGGFSKQSKRSTFDRRDQQSIFGTTAPSTNRTLLGSGTTSAQESVPKKLDSNWTRKDPNGIFTSDESNDEDDEPLETLVATKNKGPKGAVSSAHQAKVALEQNLKITQTQLEAQQKEVKELRTRNERTMTTVGKYSPDEYNQLQAQFNQQKQRLAQAVRDVEQLKKQLAEANTAAAEATEQAGSRSSDLEKLREDHKKNKENFEESRQLAIRFRNEKEELEKENVELKADKKALEEQLEMAAKAAKGALFNPAASSSCYLMRVIDFYGKLVGMELTPEDYRNCAWTLLPDQAQRLAVALQGVKLVIPHEPWRRCRFRRFIFRSSDKPFMMEHDKLGLISVQEYYEKEYNCRIQLPCMPMIVVASKRGEMPMPIELVLVDQWNSALPHIDVAHLIHNMVVRGEIPVDLPRTPRNNLDVEQLMRVLRPYHGVILRGEPVLDFYSDKLMKQFLDAHKTERSFAEIANLTGMPLWQVIQIVKLYLMWDRAVIIHPIHAKNLYTSRFEKTIPPLCPLQPADTKVNEDFEKMFSGLSMEKVLQGFSPHKTLGEFMTDACGSKFGPDVVRFLLLHRLVQQLHPCPILPMKHPNKVHKEMDVVKEATFLPKAILQKIAATPFNNWTKQRIHAICTEQLSKGKRSAHQVLKLIDTLIKLIPWLNGKIPVKEIAFQSAISEAEITRVLSTFYELMTVEYEPDIATMS